MSDTGDIKLLWIYQNVKMIKIQLKLIFKQLNIHTKIIWELFHSTLLFRTLGCTQGMENLIELTACKWKKTTELELCTYAHSAPIYWHRWGCEQFSSECCGDFLETPILKNNFPIWKCEFRTTFEENVLSAYSI